MAKFAALVTGASSGIGRAICLKLASEGYFVFAHGRNAEKTAALIKEIEATGGEAQSIIADLTESNSVKYIFEQIQQSGRQLNLLVNNAGGAIENSFEIGVYENPLETYRVNVFAAYEAMVEASRVIKNGAIVNISSSHAHTPWGGRVPHYSASKAALSHLTKLMAAKLAPSIRVNAVSPGRTMTDAWGDLDEETSEQYGSDQLINRFVTPEEVADAVWLLVNNEAMVGTDIIIDGGLGLASVKHLT